MLSQTAEYALRAVLYLAGQQPGTPVRVDQIATALALPANYLSKTLQTLARTGVLTSTRGRHGGFGLAVAPTRLTLQEVVGPFDRGVETRRCLLGNPTCSDRTGCAAHVKWKATSEQIASFFRTTMVAEIAPPPPTSRSRIARSA
jgi:Rrf2 family protein